MHHKMVVSRIKKATLLSILLLSEEILTFMLGCPLSSSHTWFVSVYAAQRRSLRLRDPGWPSIAKI